MSQMLGFGTREAAFDAGHFVGTDSDKVSSRCLALRILVPGCNFHVHVFFVVNFRTHEDVRIGHHLFQSHVLEVGEA